LDLEGCFFGPRERKQWKEIGKGDLAIKKDALTSKDTIAGSSVVIRTNPKPKTVTERRTCVVLSRERVKRKSTYPNPTWENGDSETVATSSMIR
jgi:hypothetical protein